MARCFLILLLLFTTGCGAAPAKATRKTTKAAAGRSSKKVETPPPPQPVAPPEQPDTSVTAATFADIPAAIDAMKAAATADDSTAAIKAEKWLFLQGAAAIEPLSAVALDEQADLAHRIAACRALRQLGAKVPHGAQVKPTFLAAADSSQSLVQINGVKGLGLLRPTDAEIIGKLAALLDSPEQRLRQEAILALANVGEPAEKQCTDRLLAILNDTSEPESLRSAAKTALKQVNPRRKFFD